MAVALSLKTLPDLPKGVGRPNYARPSLAPGIVHFGVGNFHRAHLAIYLDDLFNHGLDLDWAIIGAGILPFDEQMRAALEPQDWLTTVVEQDADVSAARVTGVMIDFIPPADRQRLLATLADPKIRIVSLTITEGGYLIDPATQKFDPRHPAIVHDAAHPEDPTSVFGLILAGLRQRRAASVPPYTVMSCDNVPHNGVVTRNAIVGLARLMDPKLAEWVEKTVAFPNAMVDRITPATSDRERKITAEKFGIRDNWPVFCESFRQWVVEDHFPLGRPRWEKAGAQFVSDVTPYENMKIRILNGGHAVIAYPAGLLDVHFVHEAMEHKLIRAFLDKVEKTEIIPIVPPVPATDLNAYYVQTAKRFANPAIGDTVRRLCLDGSNRQPKFIVPSIADRLKKNLPIGGLALESALWCRYCHGESDSGMVIDPNDPNWDRLTALARKAKDDPMQWLSMTDIYGAVADDKTFRTAFATALNKLWRDGTAKTVSDYLNNS